MLADFWRRGDRCAALWSAVCTCPTPTHFCRARMQWVELAAQDGRAVGEGAFAVIEAMRCVEFTASGLTMTIEHPEHGTLKVGPKGMFLMADLQKLQDAPDEVGGFLKILTVFPGSKVTYAGEKEGVR